MSSNEIKSPSDDDDDEEEMMLSNRARKLITTQFSKRTFIKIASGLN